MLVGWGIAVAWASAAWAGPWDTVPSDDVEAARGVVAQSVLPALVARREAAVARREASRAVSSGRIGVTEAFPALPWPLDPVALDGRLAALDAAGIDRAEAARAVLPALGDRRLTARAEAALAAALDAEAAADEAERAALFALHGVMRRLPGLGASAVAAQNDALRGARADAVAAVGEPPDGAALRGVAAVDALAAALRDARAVAVRVALGADATVPVGALVDAIDEDVPGAASAVAVADGVRSLLEASQREAVDRAVAAWLRREGAPSGAVDAGLPVDPAAAASLAEAAEAEAERAAVVVPDDASEARRVASAEVADARRAWWLARAEAARARLDEHAAAVEARVAAEAARRAAEEAARASLPPSEQPSAAMAAESRAWVADAWAAVTAWTASLDAAQAERASTLDTLAEETAGVLAATRGSGLLRRRPDVDAVYARVRQMQVSLREGVLHDPPEPSDALEGLAPLPDRASRQALLDRWVREAEAMPDPVARATRLSTLAEVQASLDAESQPVVAATRTANDAVRVQLADLRRVRALRHDLRPWVGATGRAADRASWAPDLIAEVRTLPLQARELALERMRWGLGLGQTLLDGNRLLAALRGLFLTGVAVVVWWLVRRQASWIAAEFVEGVGVATRAVRVREEQREALAPLLVAVFDVVLAWWVSGTAQGLLPELGIVVAAWGGWSAWRAVDALAAVLAAPPGVRRPVLFVLTEDGHTLLHRDIRRIGRFFVARYVVAEVLRDLVYADVLAGLVGTIVDGVGALVVIATLWGWDARLDARVARMRNNPGWLAAWSGRAARWFEAPIRASVLLAYLAGAALWDVLQRRASRNVAGAGAARAILSVIDRVRAAEEPDEETPDAAMLPDDAVAALCGPPPTPEAVMPRDEARAAIDALAAGWQRDGRRGVVVVTGDKGDGKHLFLDAFAARREAEDLGVVTVTIAERCTTEAAVVEVLASGLGVDGVDTMVALRESLAEAPGSVIVLRRAERAFVRRVGGFDGLRALLALCNATGDRHLWVLSMHRPAWAYLTRLGALVNTGVVRGVVDLAPLAPPALRALVMRRTRAAGLDVSFHALEDTGPFGAPPEVERERAVASFFRVLADASGGCPQVALSLWASSLRAGRDGGWNVVLPPSLGAAPVDGLRTDELFVLAALRIQERLSLADLEAQAGVRDDDVPTVVQGLIQRGLIEGTDTGYALATRHVVAVTRVLRRRHFLQWSL